jgi:hypothetical protein
LKIHHALKETSYPTDLHSMTVSAAIAITIGNYLFDPITNGNRANLAVRPNFFIASPPIHIERSRPPNSLRMPTIVNAATRPDTIWYYGSGGSWPVL